MAPEIKGSRFTLNAQFPRGLNGQVARNDVANLIQNGELGLGWIDALFSFHLCLVAERKDLSSLFLWDASEITIKITIENGKGQPGEDARPPPTQSEKKGGASSIPT